MAKLTPKNIIALFAGFTVMLVQGSLYVYGTMTPYILSYLYYKGQKDLTINDLSIINTFAIICTNLGIFFSNFKLLTFSNRVTELICISGISLTTFTLSYCDKFAYYILLYGILFGFFIGFGYMAPLKNCYDHLPDRKGLCSGICLMGFGLGALIFNFILVYIVNPDNVDKDPDTKKFPKLIGQNLPFALRVLSAVYFGIGILGVILSLQPEKKQKLNPLLQNQHQTQKQSLADKSHISLDLIKYAFQRKIGLLLLILAATVPYGLFIAFNFKEYGSIYIADDHFLSLLGSLGSVTNGIFRMLLGVFMDFITFKAIMLFNIGVFIVSCATIIFSVHNSASYLITVVLTYGCYGSLYSIFPTQTVRILGRAIGPKIYYLTFIGFSFGAIIQYIFHKFLVDEYKQQGYKYCFIIFGFLLATATILLLKIKFDYHESQALLLKNKGINVQTTLSSDSIETQK